jgi:hypothetical protein
MTQLPHSPTTPMLTGFGIAASVVYAGILLLVRLYVMNSFVLQAAAVAGVLLMILTLAMAPWLLEKPYRLYTSVVRRALIAPTRRWTLIVVFHLFFRGHQAGGEKLELDRSEARRTMWNEKTISNLMGGSGSRDVVIDETGGRWWTALFGWLWSAGNWRMIGLMPFIFLLWVIREPQAESAVSKDTYTLY